MSWRHSNTNQEQMQLCISGCNIMASLTCHSPGTRRTQDTAGNSANDKSGKLPSSMQFFWSTAAWPVRVQFELVLPTDQWLDAGYGRARILPACSDRPSRAPRASRQNVQTERQGQQPGTANLVGERCIESTCMFSGMRCRIHVMCQLRWVSTRTLKPNKLVESSNI